MDQTQSPSKPEFLTVRQTADLFQVREVTVRRWIERRLLRAIKIGHDWRIPRSAIEEFTISATD